MPPTSWGRDFKYCPVSPAILEFRADAPSASLAFRARPSCLLWPSRRCGWLVELLP
jgi:hypothetical protein